MSFFSKPIKPVIAEIVDHCADLPSKWKDVVEANASVTLTGIRPVEGSAPSQYCGIVYECEITLEPNERGGGYEFVDDIRGGSISQPFRQSVDKGIKAAMAEGVMAGYPVVDVKVHLVDGKEHPVDSKDIAFQIAGRMGFREAVQNGAPVLLEPIVDLEVSVPAQYMGDITGDIAGKRGRVTGMESVGDMQVIMVQVAAAEVQRYSTDLKAITGGEGSYTLEFSHYDTVPQNIAHGIIERAKQERNKE